MPLPGDEGELLMRVDIKQNGDHEDIVVDFGKPVAWIGFHKEEAEAFIKLLQEKIKQLKPVVKPRFNLN